MLKAGAKYHNLTALVRSVRQVPSGNYYWWFECACGNTKEILPHNVLKKKSGIKSCGCLLKSRQHGKSWLHRMIYDYKKHAKKLCVSYKLTEEQFEVLVSSSCVYCGAPARNGIDRADPVLGYTLDNCVPCCKVCNYMKRDLTTEQFLRHVQKITSIAFIGIGV